MPDGPTFGLAALATKNFPGVGRRDNEQICGHIYEHAFASLLSLHYYIVKIEPAKLYINYLALV